MKSISIKKLLTPTAIFIAGIFLTACDSKPRYTVLTASPEYGHILFRTDQKTGEVCSFRWYQNSEFKNLKREITAEGFNLVGCANKVGNQ